MGISKEEVKGKIIEFLQSRGVYSVDVGNQVLVDFGLGSITLIELGQILEGAYDKEISFEEFSTKTVDELAESISS
ncbi:hypothetical protein DICPUDRAFT_152475 [Dictyostelium purpureum]|uniref:Carrier domain-containing protein n=1 Tax=Dictyostelium purpureum TaxID=5786 RepID=F0ZLG4_DICPU|nr:uncharacterized protein DICPUDRAFT_152475 [Dictyostelium purpureum]EGC35216.1 hypothetical protein DICPUDRAFT_152475 [Dictyostelium purpureum]|eukprot:XP_003288254.1 hypothetical protein DICPUDRAFT_152475 [Dictyostelium purpureum]